MDQIYFRQIHNILLLRLPNYHEIVPNRFDPFDHYFKFLSVHPTCGYSRLVTGLDTTFIDVFKVDP
jgi:hypothetical protein